MIYDDASRARSTTYRWSIKCHATIVECTIIIDFQVVKGVFGPISIHNIR